MARFTSGRGIPDGRINRDFRSDLCRFGVDTHLTQELAQAVLADFRAVDIEEHGECAAARFIFSIRRFHYCHNKELLNCYRKPFCDSFVERLRVGVDLIVRHLGVDLRRIDPAVSQHAADRLHRHAVRERDFRRVGMSRHVKGQFAVDAASSGKLFQSSVQLRVPVHRK